MKAKRRALIRRCIWEAKNLEWECGMYSFLRHNECLLPGLAKADKYRARAITLFPTRNQ